MDEEAAPLAQPLLPPSGETEANSEPHKSDKDEVLCDPSSVEDFSWKKELGIWFGLFWPVLIIAFCRQGLSMTDLSILGHFNGDDPGANNQSGTNHSDTSTEYLAAASLATVWATLSSVLIWRGLAQAINVLASTAFGAKNYQLVGIWFKLGLVIITVFGVMMGVTWFFTGDIMKVLVGYDLEMMGLVTSFARVAVVGLLPLCWYNAMGSYLMAQAILAPQLLMCICTLLANFGLNFLFIYGTPWVGWEGFGFLGSPLATASSRALLCFGVYAIVLARRTHLHTCAKGVCFCAGICKRSRINEFAKLALPMMLTAVLEDGQLQTITIMASRLGTAETACHNGIMTLLMNLTSMMWAMGSATRVRISHHLGAGNIRGVKTVILIGLCASTAIAVVVSGTFLIARDAMGKIFSDDPHVWALTGSIATLVGIAYGFMVFFYVAMAVLAGSGRPHVVTAAFVIGAWCVCVPLAYVFGFVLDSTRGLFGLWVAMVVGYGVTSLLAIPFAVCSDWPQLVVDAQRRAELKSPSIPDSGMGNHPDEAMKSPVGEKVTEKHPGGVLKSTENRSIVTVDGAHPGGERVDVNGDD